MTSLSAQTETNQPATGRSVWRGRVQLLGILALVIGPMVLASAMYYGQFWVPEGRSYHGEFYGGSASLTELGVVGDQPAGWQLLVSAPSNCTEACQQLVYTARQVHIGLGREASRASHALAAAQALPEAYAAKLSEEYPQLQRYALEAGSYRKILPQTDEAQLWLVDPHGNLILRYSAADSGKSILNDLRLLMKLSNIG